MFRFWFGTAMLVFGLVLVANRWIPVLKRDAVFGFWCEKVDLATYMLVFPAIWLTTGLWNLSVHFGLLTNAALPFIEAPFAFAAVWLLFQYRKLRELVNPAEAKKVLGPLRSILVMFAIGILWSGYQWLSDLSSGPPGLD